MVYMYTTYVLFAALEHTVHVNGERVGLVKKNIPEILHICLVHPRNGTVYKDM